MAKLTPDERYKQASVALKAAEDLYENAKADVVEKLAELGKLGRQATAMAKTDIPNSKFAAMIGLANRALKNWMGAEARHEAAQTVYELAAKDFNKAKAAAGK